MPIRSMCNYSKLLYLEVDYMLLVKKKNKGCYHMHNDKIALNETKC